MQFKLRNQRTAYRRRCIGTLFTLSTRGNGAPELWRNKKINGEWTGPQRMLPIFSGETSMDNEGNIYLTNHFYKDNVMLEADICVAYKKQRDIARIDSKMKIEKAFSLLIIVVVNIVLLPGCSTNISPTPTETTPAPTSIWFGLLERTPLPHTTALPEAEWTPIDGTYAKLDPSEPQWWSCRRCADYRPAGGIWKLQFSQGVMRIYYDVTGWASLASYSVEEDRLFIYNDPYCPEEVGEYQWELEDRWGLADRFLRLSLIDDPCSIRLRGENLSAQEWGSCMPPNEMTGASDHWHKPIGCEPSFTSEEGPAPPENLTITVQPGDARHFDISPELYAHVNNDAVPSPDGIKLSSHADSIPYGLSRVLWGKEVWVEATTSQPFSAIGVQFLGDQTIGWARVLFDGAEVWRGNTSTIWSQDRSFGGYIEISNFSPGEHTIRAESLGFDYHPVTVAFFGFNLSGKTEVAFP